MSMNNIFLQFQLERKIKSSNEEASHKYLYISTHKSSV